MFLTACAAQNSGDTTPPSPQPPPTLSSIKGHRQTFAIYKEIKIYQHICKGAHIHLHKVTLWMCAGQDGTGDVPKCFNPVILQMTKLLSI